MFIVGFTFVLFALAEPGFQPLFSGGGGALMGAALASFSK
jgi:hypothetical protein